MAYFLCTALILLLIAPFIGQAQSFSRQDSLRGGLRPERVVYDIHHVLLDLEIDPKTRSLQGFCQLSFNRDSTLSVNRLQLDLALQFYIEKIESGVESLAYTREGNVLWVSLPKENTIRIYYSGKPKPAVHAPWDGGFVWASDPEGNPWIGVACEGLGASSWWPLKDHLSDEPDSVTLHFTLPDTLDCIANGLLQTTVPLPRDRKKWIYKVSCPLNSYNLTLNVGKYESFAVPYFSKQNQDSLMMKFHVLEAHSEKAKKYFPKETEKMLDAFEHYFGPYPCYTDGYGLVETPYWGMEHQGVIAYGNKFRKLPRYGFDFILVHESGHEWWGNSMSCTDHAEMWIHEGFTTYSEALYLEYHQGFSKALKYLKMQQKKIRNTSPLMGPMGVNYSDWGHSDNYYKGTWFLHTIRHTLRNDSIWFNWLKKFATNERYSFQTTSSIQESMKQSWGDGAKDFESIFNQYLRDTRIPKLVIEQNGKKSWKSRWENCVAGFSMPVYANEDRNIRIDPDGGSFSELQINSKRKKWIESRYYLEIELPD
jgi:aminopeptidase N